MKQQLFERLNKKTAVIGIFGLGYVGLPLTLRYAEVGFPVIGFDIDQVKVDAINSSTSYIKHIPSARIARANSSGMSSTADFSRVAELDALIICVPTPLNKYREPDLTYVTSTVDMILPYLQQGQVLSLESTTYPGTTEEELLPRVESTGLKVGKDFFLAFSPEREDPGNVNYDTKLIPKVCGGHTRACLDIAIELYKEVVDQVVPVSSTKVAEMTKLLENIHRAVNIGLVNEMKVVADKMGIDIHEVIAAAATKPFGFTPYYPGPGLGGHCIPIDPFYLTWKAREFGLHTRFIELAGEVNASMPAWVITKLTDALNQRGKSVKGSKVLVLGIAYKKNVDDMRESPAVKLMEELVEKGALVEYSDPHVKIFPKMRDHYFDLKSVNLTDAAVAGYDCVLLVTNHDQFDYPAILNSAQLIIDTRGTFDKNSANVVKA